MRPLSSHFTFHFLSSTSSVSNVLIIGARREILLLEKSSRIWSSRFVVPFCFFLFFLSLSPPSAVSTVPFRTNEIESVWSDAHEMLRIQLHRRILHLFFFFVTEATLVTEFFYMTFCGLTFRCEIARSLRGALRANNAIWKKRKISFLSLIFILLLYKLFRRWYFDEVCRYNNYARSTIGIIGDDNKL